MGFDRNYGNVSKISERSSFGLYPGRRLPFVIHNSSYPCYVDALHDNGDVDVDDDDEEGCGARKKALFRGGRINICS